MIAAGPEANRPPHIWLLAFLSVIVLTRAFKVNVMAKRREIVSRTERLIALAALAGAAAGAVAVYVSGPRPGNNVPAAPAAAAAPDPAAAAACAGKADKAKAIGAAAAGEVAAMLPSDPPQSVKALAFDGPDGKPTTLAALAGKTVLLNLWATWCAPCRAEMPALDALQKNRGSDRFQVVAVNVDTGDDTKPTQVPAGNLGRRPRLLPRQHARTVQGAEAARAGARPAGDPADRWRRLPAGRMNGPAAWASADAGTLITAAGG